MELLLYLLAAVSSPAATEGCMISDSRYYLEADTEQFPAVLSKGIDYPTSRTVLSEGGVVFELLVDRCSKAAVGLNKLKGKGDPVYGYYYRYDKEGRLIGLDFRFIDGQPTGQEMMDHI